MEISCSSPMVPGRSLTEQADLLKTWGYDAIAVFVPYSTWNDQLRDELQTLASQTGVRPCEFVLMDPLYGHLMDESQDIRSRARAMYVEAAEVCAAIGAVTELEYEYRAQDPMPLFEPYVQLDPEQEHGFVSMYREILRAVENSAATVLIEPLNRYESRFLNSVADSVRMVHAVNHPNAGLLLDFFHMSIEEADLGAAVRSAGALTKHVHFADNNRLLPGYGSTDWGAAVDALRSVSFDGVINLECSTTGDPAVTLPATSAYLRELAG
jgi:sugar phosphate isomerase/epimerase